VKNIMKYSINVWIGVGPALFGYMINSWQWWVFVVVSIVLLVVRDMSEDFK